ncbi:MAG: nucleotide pyrophosphohydrolase [Thauera sp.]|jgi:dCTP diphosphatase
MNTHPPAIDALIELRDAMRHFTAEREWAVFHTPKNLAMALAGEAGEVIEHFQWLTAEQSAALPPDTREEVALELADVLLYVIRLADVLAIDLADAARRKIALNAHRYPVERARGRALKHDKL